MHNHNQQTLFHSLELMFKWYRGMINQDTGRFFYEYIPKRQAFSTENCPIRDMGNVWDISVLCRFMNEHQKRHHSTPQTRSWHHDMETFKNLIDKSVNHFANFVVKIDERDTLAGYMLDSEKLDESSSIAHNAMFLMCLIECYTDPPILPEKTHEHLIRRLADGILEQQRGKDGSFKVYFSNQITSDKGFEFYSGESMLALMKAYEYTRDEKYLHSVEAAFPYYMKYYTEYGVSDDLIVFFANWQSQAARKLVEHTYSHQLSSQIRNFIFEMHDRIISNYLFYKRVKNHPDDMSTVQVACGLEGLVDAYAMLTSSATMGNETQVKSPDPDSDDNSSLNSHRKRHFRDAIDIALDFLLLVQKESAVDQIAEGGFGHGLFSKTQRLDVTGHVLNSFTKLYHLLDDNEQHSI